ncbi:MAG: N-acetylmuramoyl-L-alanine amidase, partial [Bacteroidales bacterium]|nr:N-acetylmuramoyl-L-alanine amidase [Bacteroidales bacterium]
MPLITRVNRINTVCNQLGTDNVILVSIHSNAAGNGKDWMNARGWSCYTTKGETKSDRLAEYLYNAFELAFPDKKIRKDMQDGDRDWEENFYIIQKSKCPAVLIENFFY